MHTCGRLGALFLRVTCCCYGIQLCDWQIWLPGQRDEVRSIPLYIYYQRALWSMTCTQREIWVQYIMSISVLLFCFYLAYSCMFLYSLCVCWFWLLPWISDVGLESILNVWNLAFLCLEKAPLPWMRPVAGAVLFRWQSLHIKTTDDVNEAWYVPNKVKHAIIRCLCARRQFIWQENTEFSLFIHILINYAYDVRGG